MLKNLISQPKSIAELEKLNKANILEHLAVLIDFSGSMDGPFISGGIKIQAAQKALDTLWNATDWSICTMETFAFDDYVTKIDCSEFIKPKLPCCRGGTDFSSALAMGLQNPNTTRIILCSDGEATFPEMEVKLCLEREIPIDTISIASAYSNAGETLLRRISEETGGQFCTVANAEDLTKAFAQLETHERFLLGYSGEEEIIKL